MRQLWIVQPYVPAYRAPFFEQLRVALLPQQLEMRVLAAPASGELSARGDSVSAEWVTLVRGRSLNFGSRRLSLTSTASYWKDAAGVILPLEGSNLDTHSALVRPRRDYKVGLWGHVKNYVSVGNPLDVRLEGWQMRRADHIFAYTDAGRDYAVRNGIPRQKVTSVRNTVDVADLASERARIDEDQIRRFRLEMGIGERPVFSYIGGLDGSKRIDFLARVLDYLWLEAPDLRLLVGGMGEQSSLLAPAARRGQVVLLGRVGTRTKALMGAVSTAIVCPGRVGLLAVEALALEVPILSTRWPYHAPEMDYLVPEQDVFLSEDSIPSFADEMRRAAVGADRSSFSRPPTLESMVSRFAGGITSMLLSKATG